MRILILHQRIRSSTSCRRFFSNDLNLNDSLSSYKVLFFGTDNMSMPSLEAIASRPSLVRKVEVVCPEDRVLKLRGKKRLESSLTKQFCIENGINYHEIPSRSDKTRQRQAWAALREHVERENFHLGVVVSFGYFLPGSLLRLFSHGAINVHPSLLPKYRGAAPLEHALLNNDDTTGVSIIEVDPNRFDAGAVLSQSKHAINPSPEFGTRDLLHELSHLGARDLVDVMAHLEERRSNSTTQIETKVCRAPKISSETGHIDWSKMSAEEIFGRYRALGSRKGIYTHYSRNDEEGQKRVVLKQLSLRHHHDDETFNSAMKSVDIEDAVPGTAIYVKSRKVVAVRCKNDWVLCGELHMGGKKSLKAMDFANGFQFLKRGTYISFS